MAVRNPSDWRNISRPIRRFRRIRSRRSLAESSRNCRHRTPDSGRASNFQNLRADKNNNDKWDVKLDGQINNRMTAFVRVSHRKSNIFRHPKFLGLRVEEATDSYGRSISRLPARLLLPCDPTSLLEVACWVLQRR